MKRWLPLSCLLAAVVQTGHAAEVTLEISPPEPSWFLPPEIAPGPCAFGGYRIEACPKQLMPEGIADVGEQSLVIDIEPLLVLGDYAAVLARIAQNYGPELALLEAEGAITRLPGGRWGSGSASAESARRSGR